MKPVLFAALNLSDLKPGAAIGYEKREKPWPIPTPNDPFATVHLVTSEPVALAPRKFDIAGGQTFTMTADTYQPQADGNYALVQTGQAKEISFPAATNSHAGLTLVKGFEAVG